MKIIIAGSGEVGSHLAKLLSYESHAPYKDFVYVARFFKLIKINFFTAHFWHN